MASIVKAFAFRGRGLQPTYPWDKWLNGKIWRLVPGKDFTIKPYTFQCSAINTANRMGFKCRTSRDLKTGVVTIQAYVIEEPA